MVQNLVSPTKGMDFKVSSTGGPSALSHAFRGATAAGVPLGISEGIHGGEGAIYAGRGIRTGSGAFGIRSGAAANGVEPAVHLDPPEEDGVEISANELERRIDQEARERLNMTFGEFAAAYREGTLPDTLAAAEIRVLMNGLGVPLVRP